MWQTASSNLELLLELLLGSAGRSPCPTNRAGVRDSQADQVGLCTLFQRHIGVGQNAEVAFTISQSANLIIDASYLAVPSDCLLFRPCKTSKLPSLSLSP